MHPADDFQLKAQRDRLAFYYERASSYEASVMDALCSLRKALTLAVNASRKHLPTEVVEAIDKTTEALENNFMEAAGHVREGPAYRSLTATQRRIVDSESLSIHFSESSQ